MRTNYIGHDKEYQRRKAAGQSGWATTDVVAENIARLTKALQPEYVPGTGKALELGCGAGDLSLWLATQGYDVTGVDIAPTAVAWAQEKAQERGIVADFRVGDVRDLAGFADAWFDLALDGHCLHCIIGEDRAQFLAAARRVLKPGGLFHVTTMCGDPVGETMNLDFDSVTRCTIYGDIATRYFGHPEDILTEVKSVGFQITAWQVQPSGSPADQSMLLVNATV